MKGKKIALLAGAGVLAYLIYRAAGVANVATKAKFVLKGISFSGLNMVARLGVLNPTSSSVNFQSFAGDVLLGGKAIATAQSFQPVTIGPNSQQDINIAFVPNTFGLLESLTDALNKHVGTKITIDGYANINSVSVPVKLQW